MAQQLTRNDLEANDYLARRKEQIAGFRRAKRFSDDHCDRLWRDDLDHARKLRSGFYDDEADRAERRAGCQ